MKIVICYYIKHNFNKNNFVIIYHIIFVKKFSDTNTCKNTTYVMIRLFNIFIFMKNHIVVNDQKQQKHRSKKPPTPEKLFEKLFLIAFYKCVVVEFLFVSGEGFWLGFLEYRTTFVNVLL